MFPPALCELVFLGLRPCQTCQTQAQGSWSAKAANATGPEQGRSPGAFSRPPQPAADRGTDVSGVRRRARGGGLPQRRDRLVSDGELPQSATARRLARRDRKEAAPVSYT